MTAESDDLRDLAKKLEELARGHVAWSMAYTIIQNTCDHLILRARIIELRENKIQ